MPSWCFRANRRRPGEAATAKRAAAIGARNQRKAQMLYDYIDSEPFYTNPVAKADRSWMNVVWTMADASLDAEFVKGANAAGMPGLKGHRAVGGLRASIYNAMPEAGIAQLVDYMKEFYGTDKPYGGKFVWDDHFTSNILRGPAAKSVPPDTELGHFHIGMTEFWFVMEGSIGIKIEGVPYFKTEPGDIITAAQGRWHRAGNDPSAPWSTRIPINPRPPILHNFEAKE